MLASRHSISHMSASLILLCHCGLAGRTHVKLGAELLIPELQLVGSLISFEPGDVVDCVLDAEMLAGVDVLPVMSGSGRALIALATRLVEEELGAGEFTAVVAILCNRRLYGAELAAEGVS